MTLVKATLEAVGPGAQNPPPPAKDGEVISVQLNPTSLRYQLNNNVDVGKAFGRSASQAQGSSSATLQFDLVFDTADEGSTTQPVDVRSRTKKLERFLLPDKKSPKSAPPRVKFTYGTFSVIGVMSALNQDYELFAESGVPLRAKLSVTIKEQKPEFDAGQTGAGANTGAAARPMPGSGPGAGGPGGAGPGTGGPAADRTGTALAGESAADFAVRMGLDPAAWKSFAAGLGDTLSLTAGLRIDFSASAGVGLGVGLGEQAGATAGVGGSARAPSRDVPAAEAAAAGGVAKAIEGRAAAAAVQEAAATRQAFGASGPGAGAAAGSGSGRAAAGSAGSGRSTPGSAASTGNRAAVSYGKGVPLRPRVGAPDQRVEPLVVHTRCGKRDGS